MYRCSNTNIWRFLWWIPPVDPSSDLVRSLSGTFLSKISFHCTKYPVSFFGTLFIKLNMIQPRVTRFFRKASLTKTKLNKQKGSGTKRKQNAGRAMKLPRHVSSQRQKRNCTHGKNHSHRKGKIYKMRKSS